MVCTKDRMLMQLRQLRDLGLLRCGKRPSTTIHGRPSWTPVYWIEKSSKKKPRKGVGPNKGRGTWATS